MKNRLTAFFVTATAMSALAQYEGPRFTTPSITWPAGNTTLRSGYGAGNSTQWGQTMANAYSGSWVFDQGANNESYGGNSTFSRGAYTGATQLWIWDDASGYIAARVNRSGALSGSSTSVTLAPGVTYQGSKKAILMRDNNSQNNSLGNWTFTGGTFIGGEEAMAIQNAGTIVLDSVSMIAGGTGHSGVHISGASGLTVKNTRGRTDLRYEASNSSSSGDAGAGLYTGSGANISGGNMSFLSSEGARGSSAVSATANISGQSANASAISGLLVFGAATVNGGNYNFIARNPGGTATAGGNTSLALAYGAYGAYLGSGSGTISNSTFVATEGGEAETVLVRYLVGPQTYSSQASNAKAVAHGGSGLSTGAGTRTLINSTATGAAGGTASSIYSGGYADATGGSGVYTTGGLTVDGGTYRGGRGGVALSEDPYAFGGSGIWATGTGTATIEDGTFFGGNGGTENGSKAADGAGVRKTSGSLVINGGTFYGAGSDNNGVWVENAKLTIDQAAGKETIINGNVLINHGSGNTADILGGTIKGDIYKTGAGTTTMTIGNDAQYSGSFYQEDGSTSIGITDAQQGKFFSDVNIYKGDMQFTGTMLETAEGAMFNLANTNNSTLTFAAGAELGSGTTINAGNNTVKSSAGSLIMRDGSTISVGYDYMNPTAVRLDVTGDLVVSNSSKIIISGSSSTPTGSVWAAKATNVELGGNNVGDVVSLSVGWLNKTSDVRVAGGIIVDYEYKSLMESTLNDGTIDTNLLGNIDAVLVDTNYVSEAEFLELNVAGEAQGDQLFRFPLSQIPDVSETTFEVSQQVNQQIAARGTEFRSMNGFASTKPNFNRLQQPTGVAGPNKTDDERTMQGWIRAYGSIGSRDQKDEFAAYDAGTWGTVIGVDKSFGNILVGLAGGFARTDLDADLAYEADVETYHGSVYASIGGESVFVDLAATYAAASTKETNKSIGSNEFDSDVISAYAGIGKRFDLGEKFTITPEGSLLASYYNQDSYTRYGAFFPGGSAVVEDYDTTSYIGSLGLNLSTIHQIDWLNQGLAIIPELRGHWLHDFNADPDDFKYTINNVDYTFGVRPREEDMFRIGLGVDLWSWKYQNTKFELDYDGLFSSDYSENIFSGKITYRF